MKLKVIQKDTKLVYGVFELKALVVALTKPVEHGANAMNMLYDLGGDNLEFEIVKPKEEKK